MAQHTSSPIKIALSLLLLSVSSAQADAETLTAGAQITRSPEDRFEEKVRRLGTAKARDLPSTIEISGSEQLADASVGLAEDQPPLPLAYGGAGANSLGRGRTLDVASGKYVIVVSKDGNLWLSRIAVGDSERIQVRIDQSIFEYQSRELDNLRHSFVFSIKKEDSTYRRALAKYSTVIANPSLVFYYDSEINNGDNRSSIIKSINRLDSDVLRKLARGESDGFRLAGLTRDAALMALLSRNDPDAIDLLLSRLKPNSGSNGYVPEQSYKSAVSVVATEETAGVFFDSLGRYPLERVLPVIERILRTDAEDRATLLAVSRILSTSSDPKVLALLGAPGTDRSSRIASSSYAVACLRANLGDEASLSYLREAIADPNRDIRKAVLEGIVHARCPSVLPSLKEAAQDERNRDLSWPLVTATASCGPDGWVAAKSMAQERKFDAGQVVQAVARGLRLSEIGPAARSLGIKPDLLENALASLSPRPPNEMAPTLARIFRTSKGAPERAGALGKLMVVRPQMALEIVRSLKGPDSSYEINRLAIETLATWGTVKDLTFLEKLATATVDSDPYLAGAYVRLRVSDKISGLKQGVTIQYLKKMNDQFLTSVH